MGDVTVAIPARLSLAYLRQHEVYLSRLDELGVELRMATDAVVHYHLRTGRVRLYHLRLAFGEERRHVLHSVNAFERPFLHRIFVRNVAVIARSVAGMGAMKPGSIIGCHDMTIDACCRVVSEICMCPEHIHKQCSSAYDNASRDEGRYLPSVRRKNSVYNR